LNRADDDCPAKITVILVPSSTIRVICQRLMYRFPIRRMSGAPIRRREEVVSVSTVSVPVSLFAAHDDPARPPLQIAGLCRRSMSALARHGECVAAERNVRCLRQSGLRLPACERVATRPPHSQGRSGLSRSDRPYHAAPNGPRRCRRLSDVNRIHSPGTRRSSCFPGSSSASP
jgi:hypothetical protein